MEFPVEARESLFELLCRRLRPASRKTVRNLIVHGSVAVDGRTVIRRDHTVLPGQLIEIRRERRLRGDECPVPILFEDEHVIAVNKPARLLAIATDRERRKTLYKIVNEYVDRQSRGRERIFIVHRLDRDVSGVMLFAKTPQAKEALQHRWPQTLKLYRALVEGRPPQEQGVIRSWLRENRAHRVYCGPEGPGARLAVTRYRLLREMPEHSLLAVRLETGRKHQIRVHLSGMGCPVVGDRLYGAGPGPSPRLALCAVSLCFDHPASGERIRLTAPAPRFMLEFRG